MTPKTATEFHPDLIELAELAKALAHPARLRIVQILAAREGCICGEIVAALPLAQATVSQHLKELGRVGLVTGEISGPRTCYELDRAAVARAETALSRLFRDITCCPPKGKSDEGCC
jgi:DNA-binding transcriptional ArsR family regulator